MIICDLELCVLIVSVHTSVMPDTQETLKQLWTHTELPTLPVEELRMVLWAARRE